MYRIEETYDAATLIDLSGLPHRPGIYAIRCVPTGEAYIGSTENLMMRCRNHAAQLARGIHDQPKLLSAFQLYGASRFRFEILEEVSPNRLSDAERKWFDIEKPALNKTLRVVHRRCYLPDKVIVRDREIVNLLKIELAHADAESLEEITESLLTEAIRQRVETRKYQRVPGKVTRKTPQPATA